MNPKMKMKITNRQYNLLRTYSLIDTNHVANEDPNSVRLIGDEAFFRVLLDGCQMFWYKRDLFQEVMNPMISD